MANSGREALAALAGALRVEGVLAAKCAEAAAAAGADVVPIEASRVIESHVPADLAEKGAGVQYPVVYVSCDRVTNTLMEKFRTFSGAVELAVEIRVSHDHADALLTQLQVYVDAITAVLDEKRGSWGGGIHYTGGYEVSYSPVKRGGKNYLQTARVKLQVHMSLN